MTALELICDILQVVREVDRSVTREEASNLVITKMNTLTAVTEATTDLTSESGERLIHTLDQALPLLFKLMDEHFDDRFNLKIKP